MNTLFALLLMKRTFVGLDLLLFESHILVYS